MRPQIAYADSNGTCGGSLTWKFTTATGNLTISGTGAMTNFANNAAMPWHSLQSSIKSLTLNSGVTHIGNWAFGNCTELTGTLTIPESVKTIGNYAFASCRGFMGELKIPEGVTSIGENAFLGCSGFTGDLNIPAGVTSISNSAFASCSGFTGDLNIPSGVTSIGMNAFYGCSGFTGELKIPEGVTIINAYTFYDCDGFEGELKIPTVVTSIGNAAFYSCGGFTGELKIPEGVTSIGTYAFYDCDGFTGELKIPAGVTTIGAYTFYDCNGFAGELTIPTGVTSIGERAFDNFGGFAGSLTLPSSVTSIGEYAFRSISSSAINVDANNVNYASVDGILYNKALNTLIQCPAGRQGAVIIPTDATSIGVYGFYRCSGLTEIIIPTSVTSIGNSVFTNCSGLTEVTIPASVTGMGVSMFNNCSGLKEATISAGVTSIGNNMFNNCSALASVTIPDSVTTIGNNVFTGASADVVVNCHYGSAAETYAKSNSVKYNNIYDGMILNISDKAYTGLEVTQQSLVMIAKTVASPLGIVITKDTDYAVSYSDNVNAGTAIVTVTGMGSYVGTLDENFTILATSPEIKVTGENAGNAAYVNRNGNTMEILQDGAYTISLYEGVEATISDNIRVASGVVADITLDGVKIDRSGSANTAAFDMTGATVNLTLVGENSFKSGANKAGLQAPDGATLNIDGEGKLESVGGNNGAGIGGGSGIEGGEITINGGTITATSGSNGAGIGGGANGEGGTINIIGGTIIANASAGAAIGGGVSKLVTGTVTIDGGSVKVNNFDGPQPKNSELEDVYLNILTLDDPSAENARVTSLTTAAVVSPASMIMAGAYGVNGVYADDSGILYVWLTDSGDEEKITVKAGGKTYASAYTRAADNDNAETLARIAGADDVKVILTPDATSKNAGYDGHIDVSFNDVDYDAYALAIPMIFDNDTIEITNLETVDFATKGLTGLLVNGTFLKSAADYDSSSEVLSVINADGKFLLSWLVEENIPLVPHTLTEDVYFRIHYRVKENVSTSASFAIGAYNIDNGIDSDQIFGIDGVGILCNKQDDFGAYLLVDGKDSILTKDYVSLTVEDMPAVAISGDVNSISLQGRAMLTGKQRTAVSAVSYTPDLDRMDAGIRVEMYEVDGTGAIVKQVGSVAYTEEKGMTGAIGNPTSTLYNYTVNIPRMVADDLTSSDPDDGNPKYMLRFSRFGTYGGSVVGTVREESYLWADIYLDGTGINAGAIDEATPLTIGGTAYLYAGAFYLPTANKLALSTADLNTMKGQVGNRDIDGITTIYNINEHLGVDAADYTTVLGYIGKTKLQPLPLVVSN